MNIVVKPTSLDTVVQIDQTITDFDDHYTKSGFYNRIKDSQHLIIAAFQNNKPIGYLIGYNRDNDDSIYCWMTAVDPQYRNRGALKKMMGYLKSWAANNHYKKIKIKTRNNRREMLSYLIKNGFLITNVTNMPKIIDNRIEFEKSIKPKIYLTHSTNFDYQNLLYQPLRNSILNQKYELILPHEYSDEAYPSKKIIPTCDLILAEMSHRSTGQGVELGWTEHAKIPVIGFYEKRSKPSKSALSVCQSTFEYTDTNELIKTIDHHINQLINQELK